MVQDEKLFNKLKEGDEEAFNEMYYLNSKMAYFISYNIVHCREDADEVVQDAFITLYNKAKEIKSYRACIPWLIKVVKNLSLCKIRSKKNQYILDNNIVDDLIDNSNDNQIEGIIQELELILSPNEIEIIILYVKFNIKLKDLAKISGKKYSAFLKSFKVIINKVKKLRGEFNEQKR